LRLRIYHTTRYTYPAPASESYNEVRLMPLSDSDQTCLDFRLSTTPAAPVFAYDLPTGRVHHFNVRAPHNELVIEAASLVVTHRRDPFAMLQLTNDDSEFYTREGVRQRYFEYLAPTDRVPLHPETDRIARVARKHAGVGTASFLIALTRALFRAFSYAPGATHVNTSLQQVLDHRRGVCQDFAHLMLAVCRRQGIPSRYIGGYLYTGEQEAGSAPEKRQAIVGMPEPSQEGRRHREPEPEQPRPASSGLVSSDAMHAWVECLLPDGQWRGFDPTNNLLASDAYVKVHSGRDYGDVPPVRGVYHGPFAHTLDVSVHVTSEK
jgi:transglutaminase-like putative cysteine protease